MTSKKPPRRPASSPKPPKTYEEFVARFPDLAGAWESMGAAARAAGPLDDRASRLVKLGIAIGSQRIGAVQAAVRHARAAGIRLQELEQAAALSASTIGVPGAVAAWSWIRSASKG